ncbi:MAG: LysM peptidoglycan-binding domain-containing protein [Chloroflexi bacterium]|nr:LysM peptidoglycan-binding domain-containing protein [Anaerolineae bacterium]MCC6566806.1 LysM peptidoglycan-binding domain-containing protein [Chloroflexota bacterium]MEB2366393.1 LysM peptidoglycan-binding domain-containing protein [Chloroflexota bacterium]
MLRRYMILIGFGLFLAVLVGPSASLHAQSTAPTATPAGQTYTVQPGDTLFSIARRFAVSSNDLIRVNGIADPNRIRVGQKLVIPDGSSSPSATPTPRPTTRPSGPVVSPTPVTDVVLPGDTLASVARRNGTTVTELIRLNNIVNPDVILVGQRLIVRDSSAAAGADDGSAPALPYAELGLGISIFVQDQPPTVVIDRVTELPLDWVKIDVGWAQIEPAPGVYNFVVLDQVVDALSRRRIRILLTVSGSPQWARTSTAEGGPPDDFAVFGSFMGVMAEHFAGRVGAYQIWSEPNLRREWSSDVHRIDPASYFDLLTVAWQAVKAVDPNAYIVSAGLAPTGFNDGVNALNDRLYLQALYDLGLQDISDAIAVHALGFGNPPDADCCQRPVGVESHYENRSFFFKNTLEDYRAIMSANGDERPLWVTKFGWGTSEDTDPPGEQFVYVTYNSLIEQANYIPRAFALADELGYIGPMFLFNFNGCQFAAFRPEECYFSLLGPSGSPRAAFNALRNYR